MCDEWIASNERPMHCFSCACENAGNAACEAVGRSFQEQIYKCNESEPRGSLNGGATFALCSSYQLTSVRNFDDRSYFHRELVACGIEVFMTLQFINRVVESIHFSTLLTKSCEHHTVKHS